MRRALAVNDLELAAASLDRFDKLSDAEREHLNISKTDFASHLVAEDMAKAARLLLVIDIAGDEAELLNGEAEGKDMARARVGLGQKKRDLEAMGEPPAEDAGTAGVGKAGVKAPDPAKSTEEILARANKAGEDLLAAAMRGDFAPDENAGSQGDD